MIDPKLNPVEWSLLMVELEEANEHLTSMILEMGSQELDDEEYRVQLGHIFAHLNRAWNTRSTLGEYGDGERVQFSSFPDDLKPCG